VTCLPRCLHSVVQVIDHTIALAPSEGKRVFAEMTCLFLAREGSGEATLWHSKAR
jgi:hypothetical protein